MVREWLDLYGYARTAPTPAEWLKTIEGLDVNAMNVIGIDDPGRWSFIEIVRAGCEAHEAGQPFSIEQHFKAAEREAINEFPNL